MDCFKGYAFTLASASPRRRELLAGLDIEFTVEPGKDEKEAYSDDLPCSEVPEFLARHKSETFHRKLADNEILITADTLVCLGDEIMGKPKGREDAVRMISELSGNTHQVYTGVALRSNRGIRSFTDVTDVTFKEMTPEEIAYYVDNYRPYDKAGAYGVQEWIGYTCITGLCGSYFNVMGLPVQKLYEELLKFICSC